MKKKFAIIAIMLLFSGYASSEIKFGSIPNVNYLTINKDGIGEFRVSFLNLGEEELNVKLRADYPADIRVEMYPSELTIKKEITNTPNCSGCDWFVLSDGTTYSRTYPVYIYVKVPAEISRNLYRIKLIATAETLEKSNSSGIKQGLAQAREIPLTVYVPGPIEKELDINLINKRLYGEKSLKQEYEDYKAKIQEENTKTEKSKGSVDGGAKSVSGIGDGNRYSKNSDYSSNENSNAPQNKNNTETNTIISSAPEGSTKIDLPVGQITLNREQTKTALDIGIITLFISVASLIIRILR